MSWNPGDAKPSVAMSPWEHNWAALGARRMALLSPDNPSNTSQSQWFYVFWRTHVLAFTAQVGSKIDLASGWILEMNNLRKKTGHESRNIINLFFKKKKYWDTNHQKQVLTTSLLMRLEYNAMLIIKIKKTLCNKAWRYNEHKLINDPIKSL